MIACKRIYEPSAARDGYRVLVDRLWPRGMKRETADIDEWPKQIAPSNGLRIWYGHSPDRWPEFRRRYRLELKEPEAAAELARLKHIASKRKVTLLTATRAIEGSHAAVLKALLTKARGRAKAPR
jgi:uncharacterized protein YeaO (DUF488 family)